MNEGDFAEIDFTGKTGGAVFETTSAEEAKKAGAFDPNRTFRPVLLVAGKKMVVPGLDEEILAADAGSAPKTVTLPPEKAFGERKQELVRLIPLSKFKEQGVEPSPGMTLDVDGMPARIMGVEGGRVRVDFNHPLAGQAVEYSFKVNKVYPDAQSKIEAVVSNFFAGTSVSGKLDGAGTARFTVPAAVRKDEFFIQQKYRTVELLLAFVPDVKKVVFEEEYAVVQPPSQPGREKQAPPGQLPQEGQPA